MKESMQDNILIREFDIPGWPDIRRSFTFTAIGYHDSLSAMNALLQFAQNYLLVEDKEVTNLFYDYTPVSGDMRLNMFVREDR